MCHLEWMVANYLPLTIRYNENVMCDDGDDDNNNDNDTGLT